MPTRSPVATSTTAIRAIAPPTIAQTKSAQSAAMAACRKPRFPLPRPNRARNGETGARYGSAIRNARPEISPPRSAAAIGNGRITDGADQVEAGNIRPMRSQPDCVAIRPKAARISLRPSIARPGDWKMRSQGRSRPGTKGRQGGGTSGPIASAIGSVGSVMKSRSASTGGEVARSE